MPVPSPKDVLATLELQLCPWCFTTWRRFPELRAHLEDHIAVLTNLETARQKKTARK